MLTIIFVFFDSFYQFFNTYNIFGHGYDGPRTSLPLSDNRIVGGFIVRLLPLLIGLIFLLKANKNFKFYTIFAIYIISYLSIYLSGERTALVMVTLFFILSFLFLKNIRTIGLYILLFLLTFLFILSANYPSLVERNLDHTAHQLNLVSALENRSIYELRLFSDPHQTLYKTSLKMFLDKPLVGVGPKMFRVECSDSKYNLSDKNFSSCSTHPHNTYIQLLAETGIIGFLIVSVIYLIIIKNILNIYISAKHNEKYSEYIDFQISLLLGFFILLFPLLPSLNFFNNWINILHYLPIGFYLYAIDKKPYNID